MKNKLLFTSILFVATFVVVEVVQAQTAQLFLSIPEEKVIAGSAFNVEANLRSPDLTLGADVVLAYDPQVLVLIEVISGEVYQDFSSIDAVALERANTEGKIYLSGVADFNQGAVANGVMATMRFKPLKEGKTQIQVLYDQDDSTLTGIIPFGGNEDNLLSQAPKPLVIDVVSNKWWQRAWSFILGIIRLVAK